MATNGIHLDKEVGPSTANDMDSEGTLSQLRKTGSISLSSEMFEKLCLSPQAPLRTNTRPISANPTPLALVGLVAALTPFSCDIMGWRGAGGDGAASIGSFYFMGGLFQLLGGIGEYFKGNTFPAVVFCTYGGFWLSLAATLTPALGAYADYVPSSESGPLVGLEDPHFAASFGFFMLAMAVISLFFAIGALRTNVCYVIVEWSLVVLYGLLAGAFWNLAEGDLATARACQRAAGAMGFVSSAAGWYILLVVILESVEFPFSLPVGDLSSVIEGKGVKAKDAGQNV